MAVPLRVVASGTVTQANMKISAVDGGATASGGAFIDLLATTFESSKSVLGPTAIAAGAALLDTTTANAFIGGGPDLTAYQTGNFKIRLRNTASQAIVEAWISATAPSGLAEVTDVLAGWNLTNWSGGFASDSNTFTATNSGPYKTLVNAGSLYKTNYVATSGRAISGASTNILALNLGVDKYATAGTNAVQLYAVGGPTTVDVTSLSSYLVTSPASTGALLLSTKSGSRGYLRKDAAFDPNAAMTIEVFSANPLPQYIGHLVRIKDSSNRVIQGYVKAAGSGETLSAAISVLSNNASSNLYETFTVSNLNISSAINSSGEGRAISGSLGASSGKLFKYTGTLTLNSGAGPSIGIGTDTGGNSNYSPSIESSALVAGVNTKYLTAVSASAYFFGLRNLSAGNWAIPDNVFSIVTAPSSTGATIVKDKGGATYNWAQKNSAFNYNDSAGYTYTILKTPAVVVASGDITAGAALLDTTTANAFYGGGVDLTAYQDGRHAIAFYQASGMAWGWISATAPSGLAKAAAKAVTGITKADPGILTLSAGHGYSNGQLVYFSGLTEMTSLNTGYCTLTNNSGNTFQLGDLSAATAAETTGGNCAENVTMPAATGALLLSTKGGSRGYIKKDTGFDPNKEMNFKVYLAD
jgi:hypothetical protein